MATLNIGFISAAAIFAEKWSRADRRAALRDLEMLAEDGERCVRDEIAEQFVSLCDFALKCSVADAGGGPKTLRAEIGYGYAEHDKDWLRLGGELLVEEEEADDALALIEAPEVAGLLELRLEEATREFVERHFGSGLFPEVSCSFYLLERPGRA
jgi:hypothetical protein